MSVGLKPPSIWGWGLSILAEGRGGKQCGSWLMGRMLHRPHGNPDHPEQMRRLPAFPPEDSGSSSDSSNGEASEECAGTMLNRRFIIYKDI